MLNEIRPNKHKLIQTSLLLQDINELFEREFDETSNCPACNSTVRKNKFKKLLKDKSYSMKLLQDKISVENLSGHMWAFGQKP